MAPCVGNSSFPPPLLTASAPPNLQSNIHVDPLPDIEADFGPPVPLEGIEGELKVGWVGCAAGASCECTHICRDIQARCMGCPRPHRSVNPAHAMHHMFPLNRRALPKPRNTGGATNGSSSRPPFPFRSLPIPKMLVSPSRSPTLRPPGWRSSRASSSCSRPTAPSMSR